MKTTKFICAIAFASLLFPMNQASAQKYYFSLGAGYGFPAAPNLFASYDNTYNSNGSNSISSYKIIKGTGSFGKGIQLAGAAGYELNDHMALELGFSYLIGSKLTSKSTNVGSSYSSMDENIVSGKMIRLTPTLKMMTGKNHFRPYVKTGIVVGLAPKLIIESKSVNTNNSTNATTTDLQEIEYSGNLPIGFASALGFDYQINNKTILFAEAGIVMQSWAPKKSVITKSTTNGTDNLPSMTTAQKETEYVYSYTSSQANQDNSKPSQDTRINLPFSSAGINVGIRIHL